MNEKSGEPPRAGTSFDSAVNGQVTQVHAREDTPLLTVLRNDLGLKGARFGCGLGQCSACVVLVDGRPVASCNIPLGAVADAAIETVKGLVEGDALNPVAAAFLADQAGQCGYCIPGIMMRTKALLNDNPAPERAAIAAALDDHLCRCGTQQRILAAVARAAGGAS